MRRRAIPDARSASSVSSFRPRDAALQSGTLECQQRLQVGQGGFGAFVGVQTGRAETVVAAAADEVVDREALGVSPEEPFERPHSPMSVLTISGVLPRLDQGLRQRRRVKGLLIALLSEWTSGVVGTTPAIAHQVDGVALDSALVRVPIQGLETALADVALLRDAHPPRSLLAAVDRCHR